MNTSRGAERTPQTGPVFLLCRGCRRAWWDDEEPACTCEPGDPDYEAWVEVGP